MARPIVPARSASRAAMPSRSPASRSRSRALSRNTRTVRAIAPISSDASVDGISVDASPSARRCIARWSRVSGSAMERPTSRVRARPSASAPPIAHRMSVKVRCCDAIRCVLVACASARTLARSCSRTGTRRSNWPVRRSPSPETFFSTSAQACESCLIGVRPLPGRQASPRRRRSPRRPSARAKRPCSTSKAPRMLSSIRMRARASWLNMPSVAAQRRNGSGLAAARQRPDEFFQRRGGRQQGVRALRPRPDSRLVL